MKQFSTDDLAPTIDHDQRNLIWVFRIVPNDHDMATQPTDAKRVLSSYIAFDSRAAAKRHVDRMCKRLKMNIRWQEHEIVDTGFLDDESTIIQVYPMPLIKADTSPTT